MNCSSDNIQTVMVARILGGAFASTGAILVGGTIADIWGPEEYVIAFFRGPAFTLYFILQAQPAYGCFLHGKHGYHWSGVDHLCLAGTEPSSPMEMDPEDSSDSRISFSEL